MPEALARDTDRIARFQREAKILASLEVLSGAPDLAPVGKLGAAVPLWGRALPWAALAACLTIALVTLAFVHFREEPASSADPLRG